MLKFNVYIFISVFAIIGAISLALYVYFHNKKIKRKHTRNINV